MLRRRRFWVVAGCCLSLAVVPLLGYHLWWYPRSPRGCFDRIQLGMTETEVRAILAPLEDLGRKGCRQPVLAEQWTAAGRVVSSEDSSRSTSLYVTLLFQKYRGTTDPAFEHLYRLYRWDPHLDRVTRDGILFVQFDDRGRVKAKTWFQFPPDRTTVFERVRSWLPF